MMGKAIKRCVLWLALGMLAAGVAPAYHHFVHYLSRTGPFVAVPEKFDLSALVNQTAPFFISEQGPAQLAPGDSFTSVVSQIRMAASVWDGVETSALRLAFGGFFTPGTPQTSPGIEVIFDEVPPGLVALGGPTSRSEMVTGPGGPFVPITRSVIILRRDLSQRPSFSEQFFLSVAHEFGHALGLQHTLTSSLMSTEITRASTKSRPLAADDVAGISLLYPAQDFLAGMGSISGRVTADGDSVPLASVVALSPQGGAVSALSNPDGTYRIDGIPPGQYYVYVHPLPPALPGEVSPANLVLPRWPDQSPVSPGAAFETQFYPNVKDPQLATVITVNAREVAEGIHFSVRRRNAPAIYAVQTYSFPASVAVKPAHIVPGSSRSFLVAAGVGVVANNAPVPSLQVSVLGGSAVVPPGGLRPYAPAPSSYMQIDFQFNPFSGEGPRHLVFSADNDIYVLPSALVIARSSPPSVSGLANVVDAGGARLVAVTGTNLAGETRLLFDGVAAAVRGVDELGRLLVAPPTAPGGHRASVVALNRDGQSSLFLQSAPAVYDYDHAEQPLITMSPSSLPAGTEAMVEVNAFGTNFIDGQTRIGFGTSDVAVRRLWVTGPGRILANVAVARSAATQFSTTLTVANGLRVIGQQWGFHVSQPTARQVTVHTPATSPNSLHGVRAGSPAVVRVSNLPAGVMVSAMTMTLSGRAVNIISVAGEQVSFQVPSDLVPGPAVLRLQAGPEIALPVVIQVEQSPPMILAVTQQSGQPVDATRPARLGELLTLTVAGLSDGAAAVAPSSVRITVGGLAHSAHQVTAVPGQPTQHQVQFFLGTKVQPGAQVPLTLSVDARMSAVVFLPIAGS